MFSAIIIIIIIINMSNSSPNDCVDTKQLPSKQVKLTKWLLLIGASEDGQLQSWRGPFESPGAAYIQEKLFKFKNLKDVDNHFLLMNTLTSILIKSTDNIYGRKRNPDMIEEMLNIDWSGWIFNNEADFDVYDNVKRLMCVTANE